MGPLKAGALELSMLPQPTHLSARKFTASKPKSPWTPPICHTGYVFVDMFLASLGLCLHL